MCTKAIILVMVAAVFMLVSNAMDNKVNKTKQSMKMIKWMAIFLAMFIVAVPLVRAESNGDQSEEWEVIISPYLWGVAIDGTVGVGDYSTEVDVPLSRVLDTMEMGFMLGMEVRKNRWGLLMDGVYVKLSDDSETPGPFFNVIDTTVENATLDLALAYRLVEKKRGWFDAIVGARYVYLSVDLGLNPDYEAVDTISNALVDGIVESARNTVEANVKNEAGDIAEYMAGLVSDAGGSASDEIRDKVRGEINETVEDIFDRIDSKVPSGKGTDISLGGGRGTVGDVIRDKISEGIQDRLDDLGEALRGAVADAAKKRIEARFDEIKGNANKIKEEINRAAEEAITELKNEASKQVKLAIEEAEKKLATAIEDGMNKAADTDVEESRKWVDPYVGIRGRLNITERTYLGARADIGGFGVGSDLMIHLFGGVGYHLNKKVELEAGWRYLTVEYDKNDLIYDIEYSGFILGVRIKF